MQFISGKDQKPQNTTVRISNYKEPKNEFHLAQGLALMSWTSPGNSGVPWVLYLHWRSDKDIWRSYTPERLQTRSFRFASSKVMKVQRQVRSKKK